MSKKLSKFLVAGASLLMLSSVGAGMSSVHTNVHAASQAVLEKIGESKDPDKAIAQWLAKHNGGAKSDDKLKMTPEERRENDERAAKNDAEANSDQIKWIEAGGHTKAQAKRILQKQEGTGPVKSHKGRARTAKHHVKKRRLHKSKKSMRKAHNHKAHKATRFRRNRGRKLNRRKHRSHKTVSHRKRTRRTKHSKRARARKFARRHHNKHSTRTMR